MKVTIHEIMNTWQHGEREVSLSALFRIEDVISAQLLSEIIKLMATRFVEEHYQEIAALLDPQAIATLTVAAAAAQVNETLQKKMPDKIREVERITREVYQRGLLGGLTKL